MEITARLTADAQVSTTPTGKQVTNFTAVINDTYKKDGERTKVATFFRCSYWINTSLAKYLTQGTIVTLIGRVDTRTWINAQGNPMADLIFHCNEVKLVGGGNRSQTPQPAIAAVPEFTPVDDLPF